MKLFLCSCGQPVYFESLECVACRALLRFDSDALEMRSLQRRGSQLLDSQGRLYECCQNDLEHCVCNWLRPLGSGGTLCFGCRFNKTIPDLSAFVNRDRWRKFETSKKRLLYTLLSLGLPLTNGSDDPENGLLFDFVEDSRSAPDRFPESFVHTGFLGGVITVNVLEADDPAREAMRVEMGERYRTVLGHLRHESGHYYWSLFRADNSDIGQFNSLFGDISRDYESALQAFYANGPGPDWSSHYISAYASAHPIEDWAETWGHYMHIYDVLETASAYGLTGTVSDDFDIRASVSVWRSLSVVLNELNRSIGVGDAYPFILNSTVEEKLVYVDSVIRRLVPGNRIAPARVRETE
jgi:hypothetical protein